MVWTYIIIALLLVVAELVYFKIADKCNIIDKPNERSSHSTIVLRGGGIIFAIAMIVWSITPFPSLTGEGSVIGLMRYLPFIVGLVLICGVSFWDDVRSLPVKFRLVVQFMATALMFWSMGIMEWNLLFVIILLILCVGTTDVFNFMDGINGITAGNALAILVPLLLLNRGKGFIDESFLVVAIIGVLVFCIFNFRPKGKAKCFAGDVGSIGIAFIILFAIGRLIVQTEDLTYLIMLMVFCVDGYATIVHRIMLHERLGEAHRKHAYQLMANELKIGHVKVSLLYMAMQLAISLGFIYLCPDTVLAHWIYGIGMTLVLIIAYVLFMRKYYHLHEEYLASLKK